MVKEARTLVLYASPDEFLSEVNKSNSPAALAKTMSIETMQALRAHGRGRGNERLPATVKVSISCKQRALAKYLEVVGQFLPEEMKEAIKKEQEKLNNTPIRSGPRPSVEMQKGQKPHISVHWRNTNIKKPEKGTWKPYLLIPLAPYQEDLGLKGPVKNGDRWSSLDALQVKFEGKSIVIPCIKDGLKSISRAASSSEIDELNATDETAILDDENAEEDEQDGADDEEQDDKG